MSVVTTQEEVERHCGKAADPKKWVRQGCVRRYGVGRAHVYLYDPCLLGERGEKYAKDVCHEVAHIRGWTRDHPE